MANLQDFRKQYPQYDDMSDEQLSDKLYERYYSDMDRADFNSRIGMNPDPMGMNKVGDYLRGLTRAAAQGATLGAADEIGAAGATAVDAMMGLGREIGSWATGDDYDFTGGVKDAYGLNLDRIRGEQNEFVQENPGSAIAANIVGGFGTVAAPASRALASSTRRALKAAGVGAGTGATAGFLSSEGDVSDRLDGAGVGAATGLVAAGVMPTAGWAIGKVVRPIWRSMSDRLARNAPKVEERKILEVLMRDFSTDNPNVAVRRAQARLNTLGPEATLADIGENSRALLGASVNKPGPMRQQAHRVLETRQKGQGDRIAASADRALGTEERFYNTLDELSQARRDAAAPLYEQAYAQPFVSSQKIDNLMARPSMKKALGRAYGIAKEEGRDPNGLGFDLNEAGDVVFTSKPSMQTLDYVKRGLDDVVEQYRDKTTGRLVLDEAGRAIDATRRAFRQEVDDLNPVYRQAREAWAGPTDMMEAMARGRGFTRPDAEMTEKLVREMTDSERDAFLIGVRRSIDDQLDRVPSTADAVRRLTNTGRKRKALQAAFPSNKAYRQFMRDRQREAEFNRTRTMVNTGSPTQPRQQAEADLHTDTGAAASLLTGDALQGVRGIAQSVLGFLDGELPEEARARIGKALLNSDLSNLFQRAEIQNLTAAQRAALANALMAEGANAMGQVTAP